MTGPVVGAPDVTLTGTRPNVNLDGLACDADSPEQYGAVCTRMRGHDGKHAAGTGVEIVEVWS